jgi:hypothetical protein
VVFNIEIGKSRRKLHSMNNITFDTVCTPITLELRGSDALAVSNSLPDELLESESVVPQLQQSDKKKTFRHAEKIITRV